MLSKISTKVVVILLAQACFTVSQSDKSQLGEQKLKPKMVYQVEVVPDARCHLGEGPHWDIETQSLYMVDLDQGDLLRFDYNANKTYRAKLEGETYASFIIPIEGQTNKFAVGCDRRVVVVNWDGLSHNAKVVKTLFSVQPEEEFALNRFNDAKCDPHGRLYGGTMIRTSDCFVKRTGEFYKYDKSGKIEMLKTDVGISNGLCWNEKLNKFYYIDTCDHEVKEYDYNPDTGAISNEKVVFDVREEHEDEPLHPDGMTIDADGNLYVALYDGYGILKIDPSGKLMEKISTPCKHITSVAFGGPNLDILFVTSASVDDNTEKAGLTFKISNIGAKGMPMSKLQL